MFSGRFGRSPRRRTLGNPHPLVPSPRERIAIRISRLRQHVTQCLSVKSYCLGRRKNVESVTRQWFSWPASHAGGSRFDSCRAHHKPFILRCLRLPREFLREPQWINATNPFVCMDLGGLDLRFCSKSSEVWPRQCSKRCSNQRFATARVQITQPR